MQFNSEIQRSIYQNVLLPSLNKIQGTVDGYVIKVNYTDLTCEVAYSDEGASTIRLMKNVALPKDGDGVFSQSVKNGDRVTISFKNKSKDSPFITTVYKGDHNEEKYYSGYGGRTIRQSRIF